MTKSEAKGLRDSALTIAAEREDAANSTAHKGTPRESMIRQMAEAWFAKAEHYEGMMK